MIRPITCYDLKDLKGFPGCCGSCHEDVDEGFGDLEGDEDFWSVCCKVATWLKVDRKVDIYEPGQDDLIQD